MEEFLKNLLDYFTGNKKQKLDPCPISLSTQIFPPCASINSFDMAKPKPVPFSFEPGTWKYLSNNLGKYSLPLKFARRDYLAVLLEVSVDHR